MAILCLILSTLCVLPPFMVARYAVVPAVSPMHIVGYMALFGIFTKTVFFTIFSGEMYFFSFYIADQSVIAAYLYIAVFIWMICLGYVVAINGDHGSAVLKSAQLAVVKIRNPKTLAVIALGVALAVVSQMLAVRGLGGVTDALSLETIDALNSSKIVRIDGVDGFGASYSVFRIFLFLPTMVSLVFLARYIKTNSRKDLIILVAALLLDVFLTVLEGKRFGLVMIILNVVTICVLLDVKISIGTAMRSILAGIAMLMIFGLMSNLRANQTSNFDLKDDANNAIQQIFGSTYFLDINVPILILARASESEFLWGSSYTYWTYAWVPRQIWEAKPATTLGPYVKQEILGIYGTIGGVNPTGPGEAYLNFGWIGVFVGLGLGYAYRRLEEYFLSENGLQNRAGLWSYPLVASPFIVGTLQSSFSSTLTALAITHVLILLSIKITNGRRPIARTSTPSV